MAVISKDTIAGRIEAMPALSPVFVRLTSLLQDPNANATDFEKTIEHDPGLTANLLRLANSPVYGFSGKIQSVRQAVSLLGTKQLADLAAAVALTGVLPDRLPGYEIDSREFWYHCVAVATMAQELAAELKMGALDWVFTAGLLHDIGKLAIAEFVGMNNDPVHKKMYEEGQTFAEAEREVLGTDHAEVGLAVAKKWHLPAALGSVARWHHTPNESKEHQDLVDLIHFSNALAHSMGFGGDAGGLNRRVESEAQKRLKLNQTNLEHVASGALSRIQSTRDALMG